MRVTKAGAVLEFRHALLHGALLATIHFGEIHAFGRTLIDGALRDVAEAFGAFLRDAADPIETFVRALAKFEGIQLHTHFHADLHLLEEPLFIRNVNDDMAIRFRAMRFAVRGNHHRKGVAHLGKHIE